MSKLRRLLLCSALLAGIVLLGAQALGMLTAHRHLSRQLAQQRKRRAHACLGPPRASTHEREVLADELYSQGLYARIRIADEASGDSVDRGPDATTDATTDASSGAWLERWFSCARRRSRSPMPAPTARARHGHRPGRRHAGERYALAGRRPRRGLALSAGLFWALFAISLARRIETSASRDISQRVRALAPGADASPSGSWKASTRPWSTPAAGSTPRSRSRTRGSSRCKARSTATPSPGCRTASISWTVSARR